MKELFIVRLKSFILKKDISISELSRTIGMNQSTLSCKINGARGFSLEDLMQIAKALPDVSLEWLMRGEGTMYRQPQGNTTNIDVSDHRIQNNSAPVAVGQGNTINTQGIEALQKTIEKLQATIEQQQQTISKLVEKL